RGTYRSGRSVTSEPIDYKIIYTNSNTGKLNESIIVGCGAGDAAAVLLRAVPIQQIAARERLAAGRGRARPCALCATAAVIQCGNKVHYRGIDDFIEAQSRIKRSL